MCNWSEFIFTQALPVEVAIVSKLKDMRDLFMFCVGVNKVFLDNK